MVGGMSTMQLKLFLEEMDLDPADPVKKDVTPWDTFQRAVGNECYDEVRKFLETQGGPFSGYRAPVRETEEEEGNGEAKTSEAVSQETMTSSAASATENAFPSTSSDPFEKLRQAKAWAWKRVL